ISNQNVTSPVPAEADPSPFGKLDFRALNPQFSESGHLCQGLLRCVDQHSIIHRRQNPAYPLRTGLQPPNWIGNLPYLLDREEVVIVANAHATWLRSNSSTFMPTPVCQSLRKRSAILIRRTTENL